MENKKTKHLYIHIPFCISICTYCDFYRIKVNSKDKIIKNYLEKLIFQIKNECEYNQFTSIYLGGGTPNILNDNLLDYFLKFLKSYLNQINEYEFCLELNPDLVTKNQALILAKNGINRVSIGTQTVNNKILKQLNRTHSKKEIITAIELLQEVKISNISLDFIYNLPSLTKKDLDDNFLLIEKYKIPHLSFYALEIKEGSILNKNNYCLDIDEEEDQFFYVIDKLNEMGYQRYEVSSWCLNKKFESIHNKAYWLSNDWKAIGISAAGFENEISYKNVGSILEYKKEEEKLSSKDLYFQILMMGLRLLKGIDLRIDQNFKAYKFYEKKLINCKIIGNYLICKNINLLDETLLALMN